MKIFLIPCPIAENTSSEVLSPQILAALQQTTHFLVENVRTARRFISELKLRDFNLLSGGQQQLVLIARALCQGAQTLILDEPTANLDFANAAKVMHTLAQLAAKGKSVVLSTHNPQDALGINATVCMLKDRTVLALGPARQVITSDHLTRLYGLPIVVSHTASGHVAVVPHTL